MFCGSRNHRRWQTHVIFDVIVAKNWAAKTSAAFDSRIFEILGILLVWNGARAATTRFHSVSSHNALARMSSSPLPRAGLTQKTLASNEPSTHFPCYLVGRKRKKEMIQHENQKHRAFIFVYRYSFMIKFQSNCEM